MNAQSNLKRVSGSVRKVFQDERRYALYLDVPGNEEISNRRFGGFGQCPVKEGEIAEISYEEVSKGDKVFYNIKKITCDAKDDGWEDEGKQETIPAKIPAASMQERRMCRCVAWKVAAELWGEMENVGKEEMELLIKLQRQIERDLLFEPA